MSQSVDLRSNKGAFMAESGTPPPPAKRIPGVTGNPPLPQGKIVKVSQLSEREQRELGVVFPGWEYADLPEKTPEIMQAVRDALAEISQPELPVPPGTPPTKAQFREITSLPPDMQAKVQREIYQALAEERAQRQEAAREARPMPSHVAQALSEIEQSSPQVVDDRPRVKPAAVPVDNPVGARINARGEAYLPEAPAAPPLDIGNQEPVKSTPVKPVVDGPTFVDEESQTGINVKHEFCPHCGFNQSIPDDVTVSSTDSENYVLCLLGEKPFIKKLAILNGLATITVRDLTIAEIDMIYAQVKIDANKDRIRNIAERHEMIDRYRLCLQLQAISSSQSDLNRTFPEGLSPSATPYAQSFWETDPDPEETPLWAIYQYMFKTVFRNESMGRIVGHAVRQFNRLVAKMEATNFTRDFWSPTESRP
jgi:hypothetical protein